MDLPSILASQNLWWKTGSVEFAAPPMEREAFDTLVPELEKGNVTILVGPRRSGKTFIVHQLVSRLLRDGTEKERIIYLQVEGYLKRTGLLAEVMDFVKTSLLREPPGEFKKRVYLFVDEVHKLPDWAEEVKYWNDLKLKNLKIFVTGSSALNILKGAGESLAGRARHTMLLPLSFREFLKAKYGLGMPAGDLRETYGAAIPHIEKIEIAFQDYLHRGGYPAVLNQNIHEAFQNLLELKDISLQRDIFEIEEIRDAKNLNELVFVLSSLIGTRTNYSKIGGMVGLRVHSVKKYIGLLEDIFLLREQMVYSRKPYFSVRKERKVCFLDPGMTNALNGNYSGIPKEFLPLLVENAVSAHVLRKKFEYEINPIHYYWVSDKKGKEIDVVSTVEGTACPVEVKYQNEITPSDTEAVLEFMEKFGCKTGIVVTKSLFKEEEKIGPNGNKKLLFVPAWLFLLVVA